ncbi:riboflavin synthase [Oikeobacillus pervagus]|uniref:Riboflavin synthase n=1 Tax=Oikeobacillus pervagus TaxID=1325931 RepID=A0AAJ1WJS9_9BACI|nr:riboflavin synthase [Oikeobacillus pervagus]MDQ0214396.1 riboflavin synthase [Oikeobacillus pervagus]
MFTGIVEEIGTIKRIQSGQQSLKLVIGANNILNDVHLGDSIAVNGVCLTVTEFTANEFHVDVMPETFHSTSLKQLKMGSKVNLERAMSANGRFGGHFVTGHVDGLGQILSKKTVDNALYIKISIPNDFAHFLMYKGSIAVDGTSLTIFETEQNFFTISLIPHTQETTILSQKNVGDVVNFECDLLAKYVQRMTQKQEEKKKSTLSMSMLRENGFI